MAENLIIVAGHAPFKEALSHAPDDPTNDDSWALLPFQRGEPPLYIDQIKRGAELLQDDPEATLIFTGGRTNAEGGHWSDAATCQAIAERYIWLDKTKARRFLGRTAIEKFARDPLQTLQFSIFRFQQLHKQFPRHITMVGWGFRAERFQIHREALGIPEEKFTYIAHNDPEDLAGITTLEHNDLILIRHDPLCKESPFAERRAARDPFGDGDPYAPYPPIVM